MTISRIDSSSRMSQAVIYNGIVYLAGQVGAPGQSVKAQTEAVLNKISNLLARAGSDKSHILTTTIWLADMGDFDEMNIVWDAWIAGVLPPARATGEARLAIADYRVEIIMTASQI